MPDLSAYLNVYNTALVVLDRKGWALSFDSSHDSWHANKEGWEFLADNPIELLGLVAIYEHHAPTVKKEYWWKIDEPNILAKLDPE